jgi:hypothetical protein
MAGPKCHWRDHLCRARFELLEGDGDERERLAHAADEFRLAFATQSDWPPVMRSRAEVLRSKLISKELTAADRLACEESLREISEQLWRFCEIAEPCPWDAAAAGVRGIEHLREARTALHGQSGGAKDRLLNATTSFRAALFHVEMWPDALRSAAEALTAKFARYGSDRHDDAVRRMGDRTAGEISHEMLRLCEDADRHHADDVGTNPESEPRKRR